ncbi:hypothetical protein ENSA5_62440 [Enhygromyxa salina]|uniref:Uncharacterized protein n=1 Tax=Enhygromyxa salina TaxID=215803 RepID=A0A2S9XCW2_9BACT|nr:hypothetical protein [Enhygromyxa salina]PRP90698.1 hypothetical protein ENSA5_62440 [Enhygromyxa salina]
MTRSWLAPLSLIFAFACTTEELGDGADGADESTTDAMDGTDETDGADTEMTGDGDGDTGAEVIATLDGVITDMAGAPLPTPGLQFCGPVDEETGDVLLCIPVPVEADGGFEIQAMLAGLWNLKVVHGSVDGRYFTGQAFQVTVNEGDALDFSMPPIVVPETAEVTDLSAAMGEVAVTIDDALSVSIDPSLAQSPDFQQPAELGGLAVPEEFWRVSEVDGGSVIAAWSFSPFGVKSTEGGFGFTIDSSLGLAADETVTFYEIVKDNGELHEVATGTVNGDASAIDIVPTGVGLHELTWLLAVH